MNRRTRGGNKNSGPSRKWSPQVGTSGTLAGPRINPDELDVKLMFRKVQSFESAGTNVFAAEFSPNAAFDVDPTLGSTETYGFDEYASLYSYYRVVAYEYDVTVTTSNYQNTSPLMTYLINSNTRPSLSGTRFDLYSTNPYCQSQLIPPITGQSRFAGRIEISKLLGSRAVETEDNYRSLTTGVPADLIWLSVAAENPTPTVGIALTYDCKITMHVRFYGRELDLSLAGLTLRVEKLRKAKEENNNKKKPQQPQLTHPVSKFSLDPALKRQ